MIREQQLDTIIQGQLTIWDALVEQAREVPAGTRRLVAGMMSHLCLLDDDALIRLGRVARREADKTMRKQGAAKTLVWSALLAAATDEWLCRHPPPSVHSGA